MAGIRTKNRGLPPHMLVRSYTNKRGQTWNGYYYRGMRDADGRRKEIPLGSDLTTALRRWAELEGKPPVADNALTAVYTKYLTWAEQREISGLSLRTISDYKECWKKLDPVFGKVSIDNIKPEYLLRYFDERSSKNRGKREIKFLGTLFNWARARGYATIANPVSGLTRQMKVSNKRTIYVRDTDFQLVRKNAVQYVQDAMDIALLTGQRPADVLKMRWTDIREGVLHIHQNKTGAAVRIRIEGELKNVLETIRSRKEISSTIIRKLHQATFRRAFNDAQDKAEVEAKEAGINFRRFQFRDLRAKAATDSNTQTEAQKLLGHKHATTTDIYRRDDGETISPLNKKIKNG